MTSNPVQTVTKTIVLAVIFYSFFSLVSAELVVLNTKLLPTIAWSILAAGLVLWMGIVTAGSRWSGYPLFRQSKTRRAIIIFAVTSSISCLAVAIVHGWVNKVSISVLPVGIESGRGLALAYAASMPVYAAVIEEVAFRGILQGRLKSQIGTTAAATVSGLLFVLAHVWKPSFASQFGLYIAIAIATTSITARCGYQLPAIAIHALTNLLLALMPIFAGPIAMAQLSPKTIVGIATTGVFAATCAFAVLFRVQRF